MIFIVYARGEIVKDDSNQITVHLVTDGWNDYGFYTQFRMSIVDGSGVRHNIGVVKIGFKGQVTDLGTREKIPREFESLSDEFFSLGQGVDFYKIIANLPAEIGKELLEGIRDIARDPDIIESIKEEEVFSNSLLRNTSLSVIKGQYSRVIKKLPELTDFKFTFTKPESEGFGEVDLKFSVRVDTKPRTNVHAIIGRNGAGKTTILNNMIEAVTDREGSVAKFVDSGSLFGDKIPVDYFSSLVSVSFSAFDSFVPPKEQSDPAKGTCYFYVGLKDSENVGFHRTIEDLQDDCVRALLSCFYNESKKIRWRDAIVHLGSDENFSSMNLSLLSDIYNNIKSELIDSEQHGARILKERFKSEVINFIDGMSSGHAIVLLTVTRLVATVEEKTLVLLDEPESHLHPPLLSAFLRGLSDLLHKQNGLAIIATHSPVVLQEIPASCVWKVFRKGENVQFSRPSIETFAENVGLLTSEVFGLEVEKSGFHSVFSNAVQSGRSYDEILEDFEDNIGLEGRAILRVLVARRDRNEV